MAQDDIPGVMGAQGGPGGARGVLATPGYPAKKSKIMTQNHGLKYPKCVLTPDPKGMIFTH